MSNRLSEEILSLANDDSIPDEAKSEAIVVAIETYENDLCIFVEDQMGAFRVSDEDIYLATKHIRLFLGRTL